MKTGPLGEQEYETDHGQDENRRSVETPEGKAAVVQWLVGDVADRRAQRARRDERGPEQRRSRTTSESEPGRDHRERGAE